MGSLRRLRPTELDSLAASAIVIDVREPGEFAGQRWPGSLNIPLSSFESSSAVLPKDKPIVVLCRSGRRSEDAAVKLQALGFQDIQIVEGGLLGCKGGCLENGPGGVWAMERQVRFAAGTLVLLGATIGQLVHPAGWALSVGVGAGLVFSALTDTCAMALVLAKLPWNRRG